MSELPINQIVQGDCREVMRSWPDGSVDLILTDPPYGLSSEQKITRWYGKGENKELTEQEINYDFGDWDERIEAPDWVPLAVEKLKPNGVFISMYSKRHISYLCDTLEDCGMFVRHIAGWHKSNPVPQARKVKWMSALELLVIATKNEGTGHHYNFEEGQRHDVITTPLCQGNERLNHPTQKPEALMNPIIRWWSFEGDLVVDPFAGTGTTLAVAQKLGRKWIGIDSNSDYIEMARERISSECSQRLEEFVKDYGHKEEDSEGE